ncbi:MAG: M1 family metallopeptidase [Saprospiraceae bacterium]|nr:M1 family metallopeptidase [Saprospiraceae bacterium]
MADFLETLYYLCTLLSKYATSFRMVKKSIKVILTGITIVIYLSCASKKDLPLTEIDNDFREEMLDTLYVTDDENQRDTLPKIYRASATMFYDLLHTKLDLRFDWEKQLVLGKATLTVAPYFYPIQTVRFDAVNFEINNVVLLPANIPLEYSYDGNYIDIKLGATYKKGEKINILIDYKAKPEESFKDSDEPIQSDKGLFFINPSGKDKNKPKQIWTQGETEFNKNWFPTFDKPNERCSQEMYITVEDNFKTLSNGKLISSIKNADGTRTDYWSQVSPHAPYLFMLAVGEFYEETEVWNQVPLHYFVEKGFKKSAKKIFNNTPEMLTFFTQKLNYPYPWDKYAQVVVRDFVSGAMENTGAVVFGEFVQKTDKELIDNDNDYIVAHELMHHWFGNLVTCEDWSNLTLNEGFANYAEYLWFEHKYGRERADYHRLTEMNGYFSQAYSTGAHPLVHYYYGNKDDMFDAHSYNKGGLVLHMLRNFIGDEAFFVSLNKYLMDNAFSAVEVDELRMAFEDVTGQDLSWFFNQWYLSSGHPTFDVKYIYSEDEKNLVIQVKQTQDSVTYLPVFQMPLNIATYYEGGKVEFHSFFMDKREQNFLITKLKTKPKTIIFDGNNDILGLINEEKSQEEYIEQYKTSPLFGDKVIALSNIVEKKEIMAELLKEKFYYLRAMGVESIPAENYESYISQLQDMVFFDPHSQVRASALQVMLTNGEEELVPLLKRIAESEQSYNVLGLALEGLSFYDVEAAEKYAESYKNDESSYLVNSLVTVFANTKKEKHLDFFHNRLQKVSMYQLFDFLKIIKTF